MSVKRGLLAGSFDPPTLAHLDLILRAKDIVGTLVVAIAGNAAKKEFLPLQERHALLKELLESFNTIEVVICEGLVVDCAKKYQIDFLLRGLRHGEDWPHEESLAEGNSHLGGFQTVWLAGNPSLRFISASLVREIAAYKGSLSALVPPLVQLAIARRS